MFQLFGAILQRDCRKSGHSLAVMTYANVNIETYICIMTKQLKEVSAVDLIECSEGEQEQSGFFSQNRVDTKRHSVH